MTLLTEADRRLLPLSLRSNGGFHIATKWYLREAEPLPYQYAFHQLEVVNSTFVAGIATGKTWIAAASNLIDCMSIPYFKALNTSVTAKQAELPFEMIQMWMDGNDRILHLIDSISLRPFPAIYFKNYSSYEFRTAGLDARFIRGSEYDRINFDEAGLDLIGAIIKVLRGRLRGVRPDGNNTPRMARLDVTTSPTAAPWLEERFNKGVKNHHSADLKQYRSLRVATWDNIRLKVEQIEAMKAEYPPDMIEVELGGAFPDYGLSMFPRGHVMSCTDQSLYDAAYIAVNPESGKSKEGWRLSEDPRHGIILHEEPFIPGHIYVMAGDPGTDNYPRRNSPVVMVADVTERPYRIVYFEWLSGKGSYNPFLGSYKYALDKYMPVLRGIDATGTQKGIDELAFGNHGIHTDRLNFNNDKGAMLNTLVMDVTNHRWAWPTIAGLTKQMMSYSTETDKMGHPQDIVMTLAQLSYLAYFVPAAEVTNAAVVKSNFNNRRARSNTRPGR